MACESALKQSYKLLHKSIWQINVKDISVSKNHKVIYKWSSVVVMNWKVRLTVWEKFKKIRKSMNRYTSEHEKFKGLGKNKNYQYGEVEENPGNTMYERKFATLSNLWYMVTYKIRMKNSKNIQRCQQI